MRNLLVFLWKSYAFFLFVVLEITALTMVFSNGHQSAVFNYFSNQVGGKAFNSWKNVDGYLNLTKTNELLAAENLALRNQLRSNYLERHDQYFANPILYDSIADSLLLTPEKVDTTIRAYEYFGAKVVSNTINKQKNYLMLNKGLKHGVRANMGVVSQLGVVGIVNNVSSDFCTVLPIINIKSRISAKLKTNHEMGNLMWDGSDSEFAQLNSIESYIPVSIGDTIITSGFSYIFPEGIMIGTIADFYPLPNENSYYISVKLSTDFSSLQYVSIVKNLFYDEQMRLEKSLEEKE